MLSWSQFECYASEYRLKPEHLESVRDFFAQVRPEFFDAMFAALPEVPRARIEAAFPGDEFRKFNFLLIVAAWPRLAAFYSAPEAGRGPAELDEIRADLAVWADKSLADVGFAGLDWRIFDWCVAVQTGHVRQFGRLQCELRQSFSGRFSLLPSGEMTPGEERSPEALLAYGDPVINLHIPAQGALHRADCVESLRRIREFSARFQPEYDYRAIVCYSWLLDPVFTELLPPRSNIAEFQRLGRLFRLPCDQTREVIWRVFDLPGVRNGFDTVPHRTSMQRSVAAYLRSGGKFTEYGMFILRA